MMDALIGMDATTFFLGMLFACLCESIFAIANYFLEKAFSFRADCRKCKRERRRKQKQEKEKKTNDN